MPDANLALISIPGEYVKDISFKLIDAGIHQQLFSDHVPIEDELEIKKYACQLEYIIKNVTKDICGFSNIPIFKFKYASMPFTIAE